MKNLLISGLFIHPGKVGGAEQYFYSILKGIHLHSIQKNLRITIILNETYKEKYDNIIKKYNIKWINVNKNRAIYDYMLYKYFDIKYYNYVFSPNYITPLHFNNTVTYFTTIHDLQYLHYPEFFSKSKRIFQYLSHQYTLKAAKKIICISDFVKNDIIDKYGQEYASKLEKIYVPVDIERLQVEAQKDPIYKFDYILSVSALYPHKNTLTLIKAFKNYIKYSNKNLKLVLVGQNIGLKGGGYTKYHEQLYNETKNCEHIIFTGYVSDEMLGNLYKFCKIFVLPSLFEGFGIPVVEALSLGKPVITTRCGALEEVTLGKAIYVDQPKSEENFMNKIRDSIDNFNHLNDTYNNLSSEYREKFGIKTLANQYIELWS